MADPLDDVSIALIGSAILSSLTTTQNEVLSGVDNEGRSVTIKVLSKRPPPRSHRSDVPVPQTFPSTIRTVTFTVGVVGGVGSQSTVFAFNSSPDYAYFINLLGVDSNGGSYRTTYVIHPAVNLATPRIVQFAQFVNSFRIGELAMTQLPVTHAGLPPFPNIWIPGAFGVTYYQVAPQKFTMLSSRFALVELGFNTSYQLTVKFVVFQQNTSNPYSFQINANITYNNPRYSTADSAIIATGSSRDATLTNIVLQGTGLISKLQVTVTLIVTATDFTTLWLPFTNALFSSIIQPN